MGSETPWKPGDSIWSGVYESFAQVPKMDGIDPAPVQARQRRQVENVLAQLKAMQDGVRPLSRDYPLAPLVATLLALQPALSLVDYGGAMGQTYIDLLARIPEAVGRLTCAVVEQEAIVANIPATVRELPGLRFATAIADLAAPADIVHFGSVLQYIEDWRALFSQLSKKFSPRFFVLSDLLVGDIPSFVTGQHYYGRTIPVWHLNETEFLQFWTETPYKLVYRSAYNPLPSEQWFPTQALPPTRRISSARHFIFAKQA